eukprot:3053658-Alexandrium_andersonii.AAC.1
MSSDRSECMRASEGQHKGDASHVSRSASSLVSCHLREDAADRSGQPFVPEASSESRPSWQA